MTKTNKKTAIVMALITVALCVAVIAGATFALFSSTLTNNINVNTGDIQVKGTLTLTGAWSESEEGGRDNGTVSDSTATVPQGGVVSVDTSAGSITFNNISLGDGASFSLNLEIKNSIKAKYSVELNVLGSDDDNTFLKENLKVNNAGLNGGTASVQGWTVVNENANPTVDIAFDVTLPWDYTGEQPAGSQSITLQLVTKVVQANASSGQDFETSDGTGYDTLQEAIETASDGDTVVTTLDSVAFPTVEELAAWTSGKQVTISGKGSESDGGTTVTGTDNGIVLPSNVTLANVRTASNITAYSGSAIRNVTSTGTVTVENSANGISLLAEGVDPVTIENSTITGNDSSPVISVSGANVIINNSTIINTTATTSPVLNAANAANVEMNNSTIIAGENSGAAVQLSSTSMGNFINCDISSTAASYPAAYVTNGATLVLDGGTISAVPATIFAYTLNRERYPYSYVTLKGGVKVIGSGESSNALQIGYGVNGNPATGGPAKLVMEDAVVEALGANASGILFMNDSIVEIGNGTITSGSFAIATNNTTGYDAELYINGGTITSTYEVAIYLPALKTFNMTGGTVQGDAALDVRLGEVNITGGTLISTTDRLTVLQYESGDTTDIGVKSGSNPDGATIILNSDIYKLNGELVDLNVTISDEVTLQSATADQIHIYDWNKQGQTVTWSFADKFSYAKFELAEGESIPKETYSYSNGEYTAYTAAALAELIDTATDNDTRTINLTAGDYSFINTGLKIEHSVIINGYVPKEGESGSSTIIVGGENALQNQAYIYVSANKVKISNITIKGENTATDIDLLKVSRTEEVPANERMKVVEGFQLDSVIFTGNVNGAYLNLHGTTGAQITDCTIGEEGNTSQIPVSIAASESVTISNSTIGAGAWGSVGLMFGSNTSYYWACDVSFNNTTISSYVYAEKASAYGEYGENYSYTLTKDSKPPVTGIMEGMEGYDCQTILQIVSGNYKQLVSEGMKENPDLDRLYYFPADNEDTLRGVIESLIDEAVKQQAGTQTQA